jgi:HSP20 family protein
MAERNENQKSSEQKQTGQSQPQSQGQLQSVPGQSAGQSGGAIERRSSPRNPMALGIPQFLLDPFSMFRSMYDEMNRALATSGNRNVSGSRDQSDTLAAWVPAIEIEQRDGKYIVSAELPGIEEGDVTVEVDDDMLIIQGERQYSHEETEGGIRRTERRYGQFYRAIPLPEGVNPNQAEARIGSGVLEVSFPLAESQNQRKQIPVSSGGQRSSASQNVGSGRGEERKAA